MKTPSEILKHYGYTQYPADFYIKKNVSVDAIAIVMEEYANQQVASATTEKEAEIKALESRVKELEQQIEILAEGNAMIMGYFEGHKFLSPGEKFAYETAKNRLFNALNKSK